MTTETGCSVDPFALNQLVEGESVTVIYDRRGQRRRAGYLTITGTVHRALPLSEIVAITDVLVRRPCGDLRHATTRLHYRNIMALLVKESA